MTRSFSNSICWISLALAALSSSLSPAQSRTWSPTPINLAQDYAIINDNRGSGEIVLVIWLAPPMFPQDASTQAAQDMLDKYIVIGVAHAHIASDATMTFDQVATLDVVDGSDKPLNALNVSTMPPTVVGALAALQSAFGRSIGALGQGVHWFAFDSGSVHACAKGGLAVSFASVKYTYGTPIPGCQ